MLKGKMMLAVGLGLSFVAACASGPSRGGKGSPPIDGFARYIASGTIEAIDSPSIEPAGRADIAPESRVIGVRAGGEARAYSVGLLDRREVVNDVLGGVPIAVTWCPLAGTAVVYGRGESGEGRRFRASGALLHGALVVEDDRDGSLWSALSGEAIHGPSRGERLERLPDVEITTWEGWRARNPATSVLSVDGEEDSPNRLFMWLLEKGKRFLVPPAADPRLPQDEIVLGFELGGTPYAVPVGEVEGEWQTTLGVARVVVRHDSDDGVFRSAEVRAFRTTTEEEDFASTEDLPSSLGPTLPRTLPDHATGLTGERIPSLETSWRVWSLHFPGTDLLRPTGAPPQGPPECAAKTPRYPPASSSMGIDSIPVRSD